MSFTDRQVVLTLGGMLIAATLAAAWCFWQQGKDLRAAYDERTDLFDELAQLQQQVDAVIGWLWDFLELERPQPGDDAATEVLPAVGDEPTQVSHPADMFARKAALLARYSHVGQHRA